MAEEEHLDKHLYGVWFDEMGIYIVGVGKPGQVVDGRPAAGLDKIVLDLAYPYSFEDMLPHRQFYHGDDDEDTVQVAMRLLEPHEMYRFFLAKIDEVKITMSIPVSAVEYANGIPYAKARDECMIRP